MNLIESLQKQENRLFHAIKCIRKVKNEINLDGIDFSVDDDQIQTLNEAMVFMEMVTDRLELVGVDYDPELLAQMEREHAETEACTTQGQRLLDSNPHAYIDSETAECDW